MMKVAIVGAGLVGRTLAWRLNEADENIQISLFDQQDRDFYGTGLIAAAMVAPHTEVVNTEAIVQVLGEHSFQLWKDWLPRLEQQTQQTISYQQKGTIVVAHPQDESDWQRFQIKARRHIDKDNMQVLNQVGLSDIEPDLAQTFSQGLYFPNEGVVDNQAFYLALNHYFDQAEHITWYENTRIDDFDVLSKDYDKIFDCRGNGASKDLKNFRSVRGEVARVFAPEVKISRAIRLVHPRFPLYIAPRKNDEYIIGATQIESDIDTPITIRSGLELLSALYSLHQGFGEAQIVEFLVGLRPAFDDNLPKIDIGEKIISINGLYRHGYLFAPILINDL
jgi:glycine oxidase